MDYLQFGDKRGNKSDDSATELPADYFWAVLKAEMYEQSLTEYI